MTTLTTEAAGTRKRPFRRFGRLALGTTLVTAGAIMLFIPGPGWLTIAVGLAVLAEYSPRAERLLARVRARLPGDEGEQVVWFWVLLSACSLVGLVLSVGFLLIR